jgi:hypothetical protein
MGHQPIYRSNSKRTAAMIKTNRRSERAVLWVLNICRIGFSIENEAIGAEG